MDAIYKEFEKELADIQAKVKGNRRAELRALLFMALEREEMVTVAYRESRMLKVVEAMPIEPDMKELLRHTLIWIWKDEDMHTIYTRGALLRLGGWGTKMKAFFTQASGAIGGWTASVIQHTTFKKGPFSYVAARIIARVALLLGKMPKEVKGSLSLGSFRNFCLFNIQAEKTAFVCWQRIADLAAIQPDFGTGEVADYRKVVDDEQHHLQIFELLTATFNEAGEVVAERNFEQLKNEISAVSPYFLPRKYRDLNPETQPLGKGGKVWVQQKLGKESKAVLFQRSLENSDLKERILAMAKIRKQDLPAMAIAMKVAFSMGYHRADPSPLSDPESVEAIAIYLKKLGVGKVQVLEIDNLYDQFFQCREVTEVAAYFGFQSPHYELVNASLDQVAYNYERGMAQYGISKSWMEADFRISFGKLRTHPTDLVMLGLGNLEWLGSRCNDFIFVDRKADRETPTMMLLDEFPPHYSILDGYDNCPDGLVGIMGCKRPKSPGRFYLGADVLAVDMVAAGHMKLQTLPKIGILKAAHHWFGGWSENIEVIGSKEPIKDWRSATDNRLWAMLSFLAYPMYTFLSNRGNYFIPEVDMEAFPPIRKPGFWTRSMRKINQIILGLNGIAKRENQVD